MAYMQGARQSPDKEKEHAFKRFSKKIKEADFPNAVMIFGEEYYLVRWARDLIKKTFLVKGGELFDYSFFNAASCSTDDILLACQSFPMMSQRRIITVDNLKLLGGTGSCVDEELITGMIEDIPDTCMLILTGKKADARRKAYKIIDKYDGAFDFSRLDRKSLFSFINKRIKASKKTISSGVIQAIIDMSGYYDKESDYTLDSLSNDMIKLIAYSETEITLNDVEENLSGNIMHYTFAFLDALCDGKKGEAYFVMNNILSSGGSEIALLGAICSQLEVMVFVKEMKDDGYSIQQMTKELGIHEFRVKKAMGIVRRYNSDALKRMLSQAYNVEKDMKTGFVDAHLALELFVAAV